MCYTIEQLEKRQEKIAKRYKAILVPNLQLHLFHSVSGFLFPKLIVVNNEGGRKIENMNWGLIPNWASDEVKADELKEYGLNAKSETIFEKPMFKCVSKRRCIVPVNGFYEWRDFKSKKYPYYIYPTDGTIFSFGCIWDEWINKETGEAVRTFSIVTTPANELMSQIHNSKKRMPFILTEEAEEIWLDPSTDKEKLKNVMKPSSSSILKAHTISKLITSRIADRNVEEVKAAFDHGIPELILQ